MTGSRTSAGPDLWQLEFAGENAVQRLFALTRYRFRELQEVDGFSQQKLADKMGLTRSQVSRSFSNPSMMTIRSAAKMLAAMDRSLEFRLSDPYALGDRDDGTVPAMSSIDRGSHLRLVAAPGTHAAPSAGAAAAPSAPEVLGKLETDRGSAEFVYLDKRVFLVLTGGEGSPTRLTLGEQSFDLRAILPGSNTFETAAKLDRGLMTTSLKRWKRSPEQHPIFWS